MRDIIFSNCGRALKAGAAAVMLVACTNGEPVFIESRHEHLRYTGIWRQEPQSAAINWQGGAVELRFRGAGVAAVIESANGGDQYRVILDGAPAATVLVLEPGKQRYEIARGLDAGDTHSVVLFKETYSAAENRFHGFELKGQALEPPPRPDLRIAFLGDSNMDGSSLYSEKNAGASGTYYAFPASVSRMLGAEMQLQAIGGATLAGPGTNTVMFFIRSADGVMRDDSYRTGFEPDVIVVNAGANDIFNIDEASRKEAVKRRYREVIAELRNAYGNEPHIVLMNAYGWDPDEPANYSGEVAGEASAGVSVLLFPWLWEQWHGSQWDHSGQAYMLARHIAALDERWVIQREHDIIDSFDAHGDVTNGGFEHVAPFGGFGWRYFEDGVERVDDPDAAPEGRFFIRLDEDEEVHQPTDATGDLLPGATQGGEQYVVTALIRSPSPGGRATISTHFEGRKIYTHDDDPTTFQSSIFNVTAEWQRYTHTATADSGVWTVFHYLQSSGGTVEFDDVRVEYRPVAGAP